MQVKLNFCYDNCRFMQRIGALNWYYNKKNKRNTNDVRKQQRKRYQCNNTIDREKTDYDEDVSTNETNCNSVNIRGDRFDIK